MNKKIKKNKAFTLLELLIVVAIIGLLIAIAIPTFEGVIARGRDTTIKASLDGLPERAMIFETAHGTLTGFCASPDKAEMRDAVVGTGIPANRIHCLETPGLVTMSSPLHTTRAYWLVDSARGIIGHGASLAGLVAWWEMNEGAGTMVRDRSVNANHGTITGATWGAGHLRFDGVDDFVQVPDVGTPPQLTLEVWINTKSTITWQCIIERGSPAVVGWHFFVHNGNRLYTNLGGETLFTPAGSITLNTWHYVVATWDGSTVRIYIDGTERASAALGLLFTAGDRVYIGIRMGTHLPFNGLIDEVRIYNRALTAEEIAASFRRGR